MTSFTKNNLVKIQKLLLKIPEGKVTTYAILADKLKVPRGGRYVGNLLHINPLPERYPCYKVVKSNGESGGYARGAKEKIKRLRQDGISIRSGRIENFPIFLETFEVL